MFKSQALQIQYPVFILAMLLNMILVVYVLPCILSNDFNKLSNLYIHVHISLHFYDK